MGSYGNMKRRLESEISELENRIEELEEGRETTITTDYYELEEDNSLWYYKKQQGWTLAVFLSLDKTPLLEYYENIEI